jgi:hypothetical protein
MLLTHIISFYNLKFNWTGLCLEANPFYWFRLSYRKCAVIGAVVGHDLMEEVTFQVAPNDMKQGLMGGIMGKDFDSNRRQSPKKEQLPRYTVPLADVLVKFKAPKVIDYLPLDVEGAEKYIMSAFPFHDYTIRLLTIERPSEELVELLQKHKFVYVCTMGGFGEKLFSHISAIPSLNLDTLFSLPQAGRYYRDRADLSQYLV